MDILSWMYLAGKLCTREIPTMYYPNPSRRGLAAYYVGMYREVFTYPFAPIVCLIQVLYYDSRKIFRGET